MRATIIATSFLFSSAFALPAPKDGSRGTSVLSPFMDSLNTKVGGGNSAGSDNQIEDNQVKDNLKDNASSNQAATGNSIGRNNANGNSAGSNSANGNTLQGLGSGNSLINEEEGGFWVVEDGVIVLSTF
ncbi:hypothetical protein Q7P37_006130 [Cladosporium fusiforme]